VAFVRGGLIEIAAHDPRQGAVFYTLRQLPDAARLERQNGCLGCHYSHATLGVPGFLVRSIPTASDGQTLPWLGNVVPNHSTPVEERWGGWYVTGAVSSQEHSGNLFIENSRASEMPPERPAALQDLRSQLNTDGYLSPYSDVVAHLLFEHQLRMMNILTRIGWEARLVSSDSGSESTLHESVEEAVDYLLFINEAHLDPLEGASSFAQEFSSRGPYDKRGRSLRQLRLSDRLMEYPCSYMIYTNAFDGLPSMAKDAIYRRLWEVLSGAAPDARYRHLSRSDRQAIVEIVEDTKADLPAYFRASRL